MFNYRFANFWCDILVGKPDLDIRTTSRTPQHLSCWSTSPCSYNLGDWRLFGLTQRMKCGVVLSRRCINWNNWPYIPTQAVNEWIQQDEWSFFIQFKKYKLQQSLRMLMPCLLLPYYSSSAPFINCFPISC